MVCKKLGEGLGDYEQSMLYKNLKELIKIIISKTRKGARFLNDCMYRVILCKLDTS